MAYPRRPDSYNAYGAPDIDPAVPQYDPSAPKPAPYKSPQTIGQEIRHGISNVGDAIKQAPSDLRNIYRDTMRDPVDALGRAAAPLAGGSSLFSGASKIAQASNNTRKAIDITRQVSPGAAAIARNALPTYGQTALGAASAVPTAVTLGAVDRAQTGALQPNAGFKRLDDGTLVYPTEARMPGAPRPADSKLGDGTPVFASEAKLNLPPTDGVYRGKDSSGGNAYSNSARGLAEAMRLANQQRAGGFAFGNAGGGSNAPADGNATPGRNYADSVQRRGNQGAVIKNPHGMSIEDRMRGLLTSMKGSPSMRKAAAEAMLAEQKDGYDSRQAALDREATADSEQMQARLKANESFADRRLKADAFNQELGFRRLQHNDESILKAAEIAVNERNGVPRRAADSAGKDPEATFISDRYKDVLEKTGSPEAALLEANRMGAQAGITVDSPITRYGQTADSDELNAARDTFNNRWTASSNPDFDPNTAKPVIRTFGDRLKTVFPGGVDPSDRKWEDANGNVDYTDPYAFKTGETPGAYALRRKRELEVRNMQGGK